MARPFGRVPRPPSLGSFGSGLGSGLGGLGAGLGAAQRAVPGDEFLPTEEMVDEAAQEIDDQEGLLTKILMFPDRILGGQMIRGLLAGEGERGAADNLARGALNNPIFQLTDSIGLTNLTRDVDFAEVRESGSLDAFGLGGRGARVREGFGNFMINLSGEILSSPLELMLTPFGKVPGAAAKAAAAGGKALSKKTLVQSVEEGMRAMAVFEVPFTNYGFVAKTPKNLDLAIARGLSKTAERLNQVPLVRSVSRAFNRTFVGAPTLRKGAQEITGAETNLFAHQAVEGAEEYSRTYGRASSEHLSELSIRYDKLMKLEDHEDILFVTRSIEELGVSELDTAASLRDLVMTGPEYSKAQGRLARLLSGTDEKAKRFQELREGALAGFEVSKKELREEFPNVSIFQDSHFIDPAKRARRFEAMGLDPIPGVDFRADTRKFGFDLSPDMQNVFAQGAKNLENPSRLIKQNIDPDRIESAVLASGMQAPENAVIAAQREKALGAFDRLRSKHGDELVEEIADVVLGFNDLMREHGHKDVIEGLINMTTGTYVPRIVDQRVIDALNEQFVHGLRKQFPAIGKAGKKFFQEQRKFTEMTAMEVNILAREVGINFTGHRPLKEFESSVQEGVNAFMARIFGDDELKALKNMGPDGKSTWEFFAGNPVLNYWKRLKGSEDAVKRQFLAKTLTGKGSPMVLEEFTLAEIQSKLHLLDPAVNGWDRPLTFFLVDDKGVTTTLRSDQMIRAAVDQDLAAKRVLTTRFIRDDIAKQLREGKMSIDDILSRVQPATKLNTKSSSADLAVNTSDHWSVAKLKEHLADVQRIDAEQVVVGKGRALTRQQAAEAVGAARAGLSSARAAVKQAKTGGLAATSKSFTDEVFEAAETAAQFGDDKFLLADLYDAYKAKGGKLALPEFKSRTLKEFAGREGAEFTRLDFVEGITARDPEKGLDRIRRSLIQDRGSDRHILKLKGRPVREAPGLSLDEARRSVKEQRAILEGAQGDAKKVSAELRARRASAMARVRDIQQGLRDELEEIRSIRKELGVEAKGETKVRTELARRIQQEATATGDLESQAIAIMKHQRRYGAIAIEELREKYPDMYKRLVEKHGNSRVVAMDGAVSQEVFGPKGMLDRLYSPDLLASKFRAFDEATQWWKQWTLAFPQTRVRDMVTNFVMLTMGGAKVRRLTESMRKGSGLHKAMRDALNNDFTALDAFKFVRDDGAELTGRELYERMYGKGMLSGGYLRDEISAHGMEAAFAAGGRPASERFAKGFLDGLLPPIGPLKNLRRAGDNPIIKANHHIADVGDGYAKVHGTMARWLDGEDLEDALEFTNAWMYNPAHGKTLVERQVFRRFVPFYNWTRFAVKNQVSAYFKHPGSLARWEKMRQAAMTAAGVDENEWDDILPDYIVENFGVPDPGLEGVIPGWRGSPDGPEFYLFGSYIPIGEMSNIAEAIGNFGKSDGSSALDYLGTRLNPGLKAVIETVANRSFFSGRTIEQFPGEHAEMFGVPMPKRVANVIRNFRFLNEVDRLNILSFQDMDELRLRLGPDAVSRGQLGTRAELPLFQRFMSGAFGVLPRGQVVDAEEEARFKRGQLERERSKFKGLLRRRAKEIERPNREADIENIQEEIADVMARLRNVNRVSPEPVERP